MMAQVVAKIAHKIRHETAQAALSTRRKRNLMTSAEALMIFRQRQEKPNAPWTGVLDRALYPSMRISYTFSYCLPT